MQIKDLELSLELSHEEQAAVHGGGVSNVNAGAIGFGPVIQSGGSGFSAFSPSSNSNAQLASLNQTNVGFDNDTAALIGSAVGFLQMA